MLKMDILGLKTRPCSRCGRDDPRPPGEALDSTPSRSTIRVYEMLRRGRTAGVLPVRVGPRHRYPARHECDHSMTCRDQRAAPARSPRRRMPTVFIHGSSVSRREYAHQLLEEGLRPTYASSPIRTAEPHRQPLRRLLLAEADVLRKAVARRDRR